MRRYYRKSSSEFKDWEHKENASEGLVFPQNMVRIYLFDETSLSHGERYCCYE